MHLAHLHGGELLVVHVTNRRLATTESAQRTVTDAFSALRRLTDAEPYHQFRSAGSWRTAIQPLSSPASSAGDADLAAVGGHYRAHRPAWWARWQTPS